jgi:hypothetical protein
MGFGEKGSAPSLVKGRVRVGDVTAKWPGQRLLVAWPGLGGPAQAQERPVCHRFWFRNVPSVTGFGLDVTGFGSSPGRPVCHRFYIVQERPVCHRFYVSPVLCVKDQLGLSDRSGTILWIKFSVEIKLPKPNELAHLISGSSTWPYHAQAAEVVRAFQT